MTGGGYRHAKQEIRVEAVGGGTECIVGCGSAATGVAVEDVAGAGAAQVRSRTGWARLVGCPHCRGPGVHGEQPGELAEASGLARAAVAAGEAAVSSADATETRW